jgi:chromate transporter
MLLRVFFGFGVQSFGAGPALAYMMRDTLVRRYGWLSAEEFTHTYAITQITPGINLLALALLVGWRADRLAGALLALGALLLPSVTITILMTAFYLSVRQFDIVQDALRGVVPATIGLTLLLIFALARPLLVASWHEGRGSLLFSGLLLLGSSALVWWSDLPVIVIILLAGCVGALFRWLWPAPAGQQE